MRTQFGGGPPSIFLPFQKAQIKKNEKIKSSTSLMSNDNNKNKM
jgi:hypothetical protein